MYDPDQDDSNLTRGCDAEEPETEFWEAWVDGQEYAAVTFEVAAGLQSNVVDVAAAVLGVEVSEALNVRRI